MRKPILIAGFLALMATPAWAHPGHPAAGLSAGFAHPFTGLDHLLVMVAVGLWAGLALGRGRLLWPLTFVVFMLVGFMLGVGAAPLPGVEGLIVASVIGAGLAIGLDLKPPVAVGAALIAVFAVAHGYAHGQEAPAGGGVISYALGFSAATVVLHLAGLGLAEIARRWNGRIAMRAAGFGVVAAGLTFALT